MNFDTRTPIIFYFDFISPYAYFGSTQIEALAARHGRSVDWRPTLIGITVLKIMGMKPLTQTPIKSDYLRHDAPRMAAAYGVPFRFHGLKDINSLAAARAFLWIKATDSALATRFAHRIFRRLWVESSDITSVDDVCHEAAALGVNGSALAEAITSAGGKQALNDAVQIAIADGAFGVPFFIADGEPIWGGDRLWMVNRWLRYHSWSKPDDNHDRD